MAPALSRRLTRASPTPPSSSMTTTRAPSRVTPVGTQRLRLGRSTGTGMRRGRASIAERSPGTVSVAGGGTSAGLLAPADPAGWPSEAAALAAAALVLARIQAATWLMVGKSRSCRVSSRSTPYSARTAANTSACLTVSTPRSASRSRSGSSRSGGYPVSLATMLTTVARMASSVGVTSAAAGGGAAGAAHGVEPAGTAIPALARIQAATWLMVGKSRSCRVSSRSTLYSARTAANTSACLTVSTPRSASRSRSGSSRSGG